MAENGVAKKFRLEMEYKRKGRVGRAGSRTIDANRLWDGKEENRE